MYKLITGHGGCKVPILGQSSIFNIFYGNIPSSHMDLFLGYFFHYNFTWMLIWALLQKFILEICILVTHLPQSFYLHSIKLSHCYEFGFCSVQAYHSFCFAYNRGGPLFKLFFHGWHCSMFDASLVLTFTIYFIS